MTNYIIAIDGGGSSCRAKLYNKQGDELGVGISGSANIRLGIEQVEASVLSACQQALDNSGYSDLPLNSCNAGLGLAGFARDHTQRELVVQRLSKQFNQSIFNSDAYIAYLGAHETQDGTCLVVGTGSCAMMMHNSQFSLIGGWGMLASDHGSGAAAGMFAIRRATLAYDGFIANNDFTQSIILQLTRDNQTPLEWVMKAQPADYAKLAPFVFESAERNNPDAEDIVAQLVSDVGTMVDHLYDKGLGSVVLMGGLAETYIRLLNTTHANKICRAKADALHGAYLMAKDL